MLDRIARTQIYSSGSTTSVTRCGMDAGTNASSCTRSKFHCPAPVATGAPGRTQGGGGHRTHHQRNAFHRHARGGGCLRGALYQSPRRGHAPVSPSPQAWPHLVHRNRCCGVGQYGGQHTELRHGCTGCGTAAAAAAAAAAAFLICGCTNCLVLRHTAAGSPQFPTVDSQRAHAVYDVVLQSRFPVVV